MTSIARAPALRGGSGAKRRGLSPREALAFVRRHGVVVVSAKGRGPTLVEAIAGEPITGSWWGHPEGKRIFSVLSAVTASDEVLVCRLVDGKVTLVHERLWPALARLSDSFLPERIAQVHQQHTPSGRHVSRSVAFADWVPADVMARAAQLGADEARAILAEWLPAKDRNGR